MSSCLEVGKCCRCVQGSAKKADPGLFESPISKLLRREDVVLSLANGMKFLLRVRDHGITVSAPAALAVEG